jgi:TolA-binding protein
MYKAGLSHYLMKSYRKAAEIYSNLLIDHPDSTYAGDAQYWLGESLYHGGDRRKALVEFQRVLNDYPNCAWRQQAQLRVIELE